jgi:Mg2+/citrate symporter
MKNFIKKLTGLDKEEARIAEEKAKVAEEEMELLKKKDPKEYATRRKEPWVNVLDVKLMLCLFQKINPKFLK